TSLLNDTLARMASPSLAVRRGNLATIVLSDVNQQPTVLDVIALPVRDHAFSFSPRLMIIVRQNPSDIRRLAPVLHAAYQLTDAEIDVALRLTNGEPVDAIANARTASVGTVRAQLRAIFAKMGVHRQNELIARINSLR